MRGLWFAVAVLAFLVTSPAARAEDFHPIAHQILLP